MTTQQIQQMIEQAIESKVPKMIEDDFNKNYYSGKPKIPPHTHNGIDNLPIPASNINGLIVGQLPVGSIYISTLTTNPNTLLGYGTWSAYGVGQVLVGYKSGSAYFGTLGGTGGVTDVTLDLTQIPSHSHFVNSGHTGGALDSGAGTNSLSAGSSGTVNSVQLAGGGGSHVNVQPYVTVSIWQRTA